MIVPKNNLSLNSERGPPPTLDVDATNASPVHTLTALAEVVRRFGLDTLQPTVKACAALSTGESIDLAVLGQFKSGKSSLLNALLGKALLPVGVLPVTAVVTRVTAGPNLVARINYLDESIEEVDTDRLADFVTEAGNPNNRRRVALATVQTPALREMPGVCLVDTPGLGSVLVHNTDATRTWLPNVAAAMVTISAERPLSDEDLRLLADARHTAPRVVVVLTKVDLLTDSEREQVVNFLTNEIRRRFNVEIRVFPFSVRVDTERWLHQLREGLLLPVAGNVAGERRAALALKMDYLVQSCRDYLTVGLHAAERTDAGRDRLRAAVFNERVSIKVIRDELSLAEQGMRSLTRPELEKILLSEREPLEKQIGAALQAELPAWHGNLARQVRSYADWMEKRLSYELTPLSDRASSVAVNLLGTAEDRLRRIVEAFRDRLNHNMQEAMGIAVSPLVWEPKRPELPVVPVRIDQVFMVHWDLLWWLLPMKLIGGFFRRHARRRVADEVDKNVRRLVSDWTKATDAEITDLRGQALAWVEAELATLNRLLGNQPVETETFRAALRDIDGAAASWKTPS